MLLLQKDGPLVGLVLLQLPHLPRPLGGLVVFLKHVEDILRRSQHFRTLGLDLFLISSHFTYFKTFATGAYIMPYVIEQLWP